MQRVALVAGATSGIGLDLTGTLLPRGYAQFAPARRATAHAADTALARYDALAPSPEAPPRLTNLYSS